MEKNNKLRIILVTMILSALAVVFVYEILLKKNPKSETTASTNNNEMPVITDAKKTSYTALEILNMIKSDKVYLGDSVVLFDNGELRSSIPKFQGTIDAIMKVETNVKGLTEKAMETKIPFQYHLYIFSATVYREQYPDEFNKTTKDSTTVKQ
jgi:hypothetical protein